MRYDRVKFIVGYDGEGYQEIDNGAMVRLTDIDGVTIDPGGDISYTVTVVDGPVPEWGTQDVIG